MFVLGFNFVVCFCFFNYFSFWFWFFVCVCVSVRAHVFVLFLNSISCFVKYISFRLYVIFSIGSTVFQCHYIL